MQNATADWVCFANASFARVFRGKFLKISIYFEIFKNFIFWKFLKFLFFNFYFIFKFTALVQFRALGAVKWRQVINSLLNFIFKFKFFNKF